MFQSWAMPPVWMGYILMNGSMNRSIYRENPLKDLIHLSLISHGSRVFTSPEEVVRVVVKTRVLTRIGEQVYMTYVAYDGHSHPRVALSSIHIDDFLNKKWNWKKPVLISPPYIVDKNACILPEKINGKYVIFHRVFPNILIDFVDNLDFDGKTRWLEGQFKIPTRALSSDWDNLKVGCGPPPIKTKEGWLLIYQAVSSFDESRYKIGAMLLDLKDPTRVLARTRCPILEPLTSYENEGWKAGVVYPCGAVIIDDRLFVILWRG